MNDAELRSQPYMVAKADYARFYLSTYYRAYLRPWRGLLGVFTILAVSAGLSVTDIFQGHYIKVALIAAGVTVFWLGVIPAVGLFAWLRTLWRTHHAHVPRTAILAPSHFAMEGEGFSDHRVWSHFHRVIAGDRMLYLMLKNGTGMIVARSAFLTPAECEAFITESRRRIAASNDPQAQVFEAPLPSAPLPGSVETPPHRLTFGVFAGLYILALIRGFLRPPTLLVLLAGFVAVPAWIGRARLAAGDLSPLWSSLAGLALFIVVLPVVLTLVTWMTTRGKPLLRNPRRVAITPEKLRLYGEGFDVSVKWTVVRKISRRFGAIMLWTTPSAAIALPLAAFASPAEARAFEDQALAWWRAAQP